MYKLQYVNEDRNKYTGTWVGAKGQLVETIQFEHIGGGKYSLHCNVLVEDKPGQFRGDIATLEVRDRDMVWAPPLPAGYYNYKTKPWGCHWLSQTGARQYKVGINSATIRGYSAMRMPGAKKIRVPVGFISVALAYRDGFNPQEVGRALSMIKKRTRNTMIGISPNLALEKIGPATMVVYRGIQVVGIVHDAKLYIDNTFNHPDLNTLEYTNESVKELGTIYRLSA